MTARTLPVLAFRGRRWLFDERLSEVRDVNNPSRNIRLSRDLITALKIFGELEPATPAPEKSAQPAGGDNHVP